ncbi:hypothetical protein MMC10_009347 [Thelotrema lepadinum]|nr:hypothetical protein [Thelotrema lepadinum]
MGSKQDLENEEEMGSKQDVVSKEEVGSNEEVWSKEDPKGGAYEHIEDVKETGQRNENDQMAGKEENDTHAADGEGERVELIEPKEKMSSGKRDSARLLTNSE